MSCPPKRTSGLFLCWRASPSTPLWGQLWPWGARVNHRAAPWRTGSDWAHVGPSLKCEQKLVRQTEMRVIKSIIIGDLVLDKEGTFPWDGALLPEPSLPLSVYRSCVHCRGERISCELVHFQGTRTWSKKSEHWNEIEKYYNTVFLRCSLKNNR